MAAMLKAKPDWKLAIEGHTDSKGNDAYNQKLSERRAQTVADTLVKEGIDPGIPPILVTALPHLSDDPEGLYDEVEAFAAGLVNRVFPDDSFDDEVRKIAERVAARTSQRLAARTAVP